jgi:hypothetical protein
MQKSSHHFRDFVAILSTLVLGASILLVGALRNDIEQITGAEPSYTITMNSANAPTTSVIYGTSEITIRYSTFEYTGAKANAGNHVELQATGYLNNKANSQITSITSIQAYFTTSGSLTLATSFDGQNYTQTSITSGAINQTSTLPYIFG